MTPGPSITITQVEGFKFVVDFGAAFPRWRRTSRNPSGVNPAPRRSRF